MCIVVNKYKDEYDVYIGRGSKWGNPFKIGEKYSREESIRKFTQYFYRGIKSGKFTIDEILELDGKRLGCFCKPQSCHGDVIVRAVEYYKLEKSLGKLKYSRRI